MGKIMIISSANFEEFAAEQLTIQEGIQVTGTVTPIGSGIVEGGGRYLAGETAIISVQPSDYSFFDSWNDSNTDNPRNVTVGNNDMQFVANMNIGTELQGTIINGKILNSNGTLGDFENSAVIRYDISDYIGKKIKIVSEGTGVDSQSQPLIDPCLDNSIQSSNNTVIGGIGTIRGSGPNCRCYLNGQTYGIVPANSNYLYINKNFTLGSGYTLEVTKLRVFVEDV